MGLTSTSRVRFDFPFVAESREHLNVKIDGDDTPKIIGATSDAETA